MKIRQFRPTVIAAAILILIIISLSIAVLDQQLRSSSLSMQIRQENAKFNRLSKETSADVNLDKKYRDMALKLGGRYKEVTWSRHIPFMVNQLTAAMQEYGVKIETLRPDPIRTMDNVSQLPLRIGFKAGIANMAKVVRDIERTIPFLNIERLDIRTAGEKSDLLQSEMTVSSYAITDKDAPQMPKITPLHSSASVKVTRKSLDIARPNVNIKPLPMMAPQPGVNTNPSPIGNRQNRTGAGPTPPPAPPGGGFDAMIKSLDKNSDGKISKEEAGGAPWFDRVDMNRDGAIDTNELETVKKFMGGAQGGNPPSGSGNNSMQPGGPQ